MSLCRCAALGALVAASIPFAAAGEKAKPKRKAGTVQKNGLGMKLAWCPAGTFKMGSPKKFLGKKMGSNGSAWNSHINPWEAQVTVTLSRGFWIGKYEVTQKEWKAVMGKNDSQSKFKGDPNSNPSKFRGDSLPVDSITWAEADLFCQKLTAREKEAGTLPKGWEYRLPTEAEWEYACRAGSTGFYFFGGFEDAKEELNDYAWHGLNSGDEIPSNRRKPQTRRTHPVGKKQPNPWGLYDIMGNVAEWTQDWIGPKLVGGTDPVQTRESGSSRLRGRRVVRGSYYIGSPGSCRSALRGHFDAYERFAGAGFRVVLAPVRQK